MFLWRITLSFLIISCSIIWNAQALPARTSPSAVRGSNNPQAGRQPSGHNGRQPAQASEDDENEEEDYDEDSREAAPPPARSKQQSRVPLKSNPPRSNAPQSRPPQKQRTPIRKPAAAPSRKSPVTQMLKPSRKTPTNVEENSPDNSPENSSHSNASRRTPNSQSPASGNRRGNPLSLKSQTSSQEQSSQNSSKKSSISKRKSQTKTTPTVQASSSEQAESSVESNSAQSSSKKSESIIANNQEPQPMEKQSVATAQAISISRETPTYQELSTGSQSSVQSSQFPVRTPAKDGPGPVAVQKVDNDQPNSETPAEGANLEADS